MTPESVAAEPTHAEIERFLRSLHATQKVRDIAAFAVNEGRILTNADRMTVLVKVGSTLSLEAVTGQKQPKKNSAELIQLRKIASDALKSREALHYAGTSEQKHPPLHSNTLLLEYVRESGATCVSIFPLLDSNSKERPVGCLVVESFRQGTISFENLAGIEILCAHLGIALQRSLRYENILFHSTLSRLGSAARWLVQNKLTLVSTLSVAVFIASLVLCFLPWEYRITCNGTLNPSSRQDLFAPWDAEVEQVLVADGDVVESGQLLLRLTSNDLNIEAVALEAVIREKKKLLAALEAQIDVAERASNYEESVQLQGDAKKTEVEIEGNSKRLQLVKQRIESLNISAPFAGTVVGFQLRQLLQDRPVQRGERLLQLMQTQEDWRLEISVPERYSGHMMQAFEIRRDLDVDFVLSTAVDQTYSASLTSIATRVEESETEGSYLEGLADVTESQELEGRHIGARVIAKINCGEKSLGYCIFGDVVDFFRRRLWF